MSLKRIDIIGAGSVSIPFFCDVVKVMEKHYGKRLIVPNERMDLIRQAASVLETIGQECRDAAKVKG